MAPFNAVRFAAAIVLTLASTLALAQGGGPFRPEVPEMFAPERAMSVGPSLTVLSTTTVLEKSRPESVIDRNGVHHVISYDGQGHINAVTQPELQRVFVLAHDADGKLSELTMIDLTTGKTIYPLHRKAPAANNDKLLLAQEPPPDHYEDIIVLGSYDNPAGPAFWGGNGPPDAISTPMNPGPVGACSKSGCNGLCDKANNLTMTLCGLWALVPGQQAAAAACAVTALVTYSACTSHCDGECQNP